MSRRATPRHVKALLVRAAARCLNTFDYGPDAIGHCSRTPFGPTERAAKSAWLGSILPSAVNCDGREHRCLHMLMVAETFEEFA